MALLAVQSQIQPNTSTRVWIDWSVQEPRVEVLMSPNVALRRLLGGG